MAEVTSAAGDLVHRMFAAVAQFDRDQLVERTHAGLERAKAEGKKLGRKPALSDAQQAEARELLAEDIGVGKVVHRLGVPHPTILRVQQSTAPYQPAEQPPARRPTPSPKKAP